MKNQFTLLLFFALLISISSCSKEEDLANQVGKWNGIINQTRSTDGITTFESPDIEIELQLNEDGNGHYTSQVFDHVKIFWVLDSEAPDRIFLILEHLFNGSGFHTTMEFQIEKNTPVEQEWVSTNTYTSLDGDTITTEERWMLSR